MQICFQDFRVFHEPGPVALKPITILVGENSAGKSSFLAGTRFLLEMLSGSADANFNKEPFFLGAYDQIAHYRGGRFGRAPTFSMSATATSTEIRKGRKRRGRDETQDEQCSLRVTFADVQSQPSLQTVSLVADDLEVIIDLKSLPSFRLRYQNIDAVVGEPHQNELFVPSPTSTRNHLFFITRVIVDWAYEILQKSEPNNEYRQSARAIIERLDWANRFSRSQEVYASAPFRTQPERTYSPVEAVSSAEGTHVPILLAQLKSFDPKKWAGIKEKLVDFGKKSKLFQEIDVKRLGRSNSDPFQLMITVSKVRSNIIDVGYGISQVLPIVVELLSNEIPSYFLFQQPEVHLHPQAQAELGSFLLNFVLQSKKTIVLETHSDYIVDRIRSDLVRAKLKPSEVVSILYFEKSQFDTKIHEIKLDDNGQVVDPPDGYREFFLRESLRTLRLD